MSVEERVLNKLDFEQVLGRLGRYCFLPRAEELAASLTPYTEYGEVQIALQETDEGKELLRSNPLFSARGAKEIRLYLERCERGGYLDPDELLQVRDTVRVGRQCRQVLWDGKLDLARLREIASLIEPQRWLEDEISRCITEDAVVADSASELLTNLRKSKNRLQQRIRETLENILRSSSHQKMLQESLITLRSDRYVVPIKQEYRSAFAGIVHDQSASGATLFIEPMQVVHLGNELREVTLKEQHEVERILYQLSGNIAERIEQILRLSEGLAYLDFVLAKAHLSNEMNAGAPNLLSVPQVKLVQARHPLLKGTVVPVTVELGVKFDSLVVTGPNTGGKTVALKTIGLLVAMNQAGLHIPAEGDSSLGIFSQIFVDIGDEQSVEQSLSTFSGHMKNIVHILDKADAHSLVLLDEIGAGTDPTEGAALAMSILAELHERGCKVVATTHYGVLKTFAYNTARVENASVEFDIETLCPTYRLLIGIPGKSNAFNIAGRLGLSERVLTTAKTYMTEREMQVTDLIGNLEDTQREIEAERRKAQEERLVVAEQNKALQHKSQRQAEEHQDLLLKAKDEAAKIIRDAKREAEALIQDLKEEMKSETKRQQAIDKARTNIRGLSARLEEELPRTSGGVTKEQLKPGQTIYMTKLRQNGQVLQVPNEHGEVLVQAGILKVSVQLEDIRLVNSGGSHVARTGAGASAGKLGRTKAENIRNELDLRGMLVDEATYALDKYLDDAVLTGVSQLYVIHGKGTGALRSGVQDFLRGHPHVKAYRLGQHGEGDVGVTVVELK